ncbi:energy-coupling factor ABC transporter ATP-binding protein [Gracilibacillus sp. YIM 98692]|uniref:energy-coupling factor ABC transporter ATP-binding protein n=1 Tax=Gracilibacillus sp. YIM 98692 TaxID=2663532 RepID=UPI0013D3271D|nr:energy-coupling factor ABC transporter ATP-binding protein [Gracilibacillus sp. YIM 98692]
MEIQFHQVNYVYQENTPFQYHALKDINLTIPSGSFTAIIGHTGSGKSTLLQHINGLLLATDGYVRIGNVTLSRHYKRQHIKSLRSKIGVVFQYPEHQLFEETVEKDIAFGPKNFGLPHSEIQERIERVIEAVGISKHWLNKSPFQLSGGQMRRVAIAGVLAMRPEVLVLDEPTAGLDPKGQDEIMSLFYHLHKQHKLTTILVTHQMRDALAYADKVMVLNQGIKYLEGQPADVFQQNEVLEKVNLKVPESIQLIQKLNKKFGSNLTYHHQSIDQMAKEIATLLKGYHKR